VSAQNLLVCVNKLHLARRRSRLQVLKTGAFLVDPEHGAADCDGTRRHNKRFVILCLQPRNIVRQ